MRPQRPGGLVLRKGGLRQFVQRGQPGSRAGMVAQSGRPAHEYAQSQGS